MSKKLILAAVAAAALSGCAIHQNVTPAQRFEERQVCVIENPSVRSTFLDAYKRALTAKGYAVKTLPADAVITDCPVTSTYAANWRWDLALYLAYADIRVYRAGTQIGQATYDARDGGGSLNKFIDAEKKVNELVGSLFVGGAGTASMAPPPAIGG